METRAKLFRLGIRVSNELKGTARPYAATSFVVSRGHDKTMVKTGAVNDRPQERE